MYPRQGRVDSVHTLPTAASAILQESTLSAAKRIDVQHKELAMTARLAASAQKPAELLKGHRQQQLQASAQEVSKGFQTCLDNVF